LHDCACVRREAEALGKCKACKYDGYAVTCDACVAAGRTIWTPDPDLIECDRCRELFASRLDLSIVAGYHCCPDCAE
jgi:hypothetical protein